ncbi:MAG: YjjW family glycine radical enzyme activase [Bacillota bacterium]
MILGHVNKILPFSSVDGPGNRTVIFLQGCNFDCLYCHNPETIRHCSHCGQCIEACPYGALSLKEDKVTWDQSLCQQCDACLKACQLQSSPKVMPMAVEDVMRETRKVKAFIQGITVSGGECTLQVDFVTALFTEAKKLGLSTFLDSNGYIPLWEEKELLEVMDMAMIDVKAFDPREHQMLTGQDNGTVVENVRFLAEQSKLYEIRTVIVPGLLNNQYNVDQISKLIASLQPDIRYKLIRYRPMGVREGFVDSDSPDDEFMMELKALAESNGCREVIVV